jgi:hypothetical protein
VSTTTSSVSYWIHFPIYSSSLDRSPRVRIRSFFHCRREWFVSSSTCGWLPIIKEFLEYFHKFFPVVPNKICFWSGFKDGLGSNLNYQGSFNAAIQQFSYIWEWSEIKGRWFSWQNAVRKRRGILWSCDLPDEPNTLGRSTAAFKCLFEKTSPGLRGGSIGSRIPGPPQEVGLLISKSWGPRQAWDWGQTRPGQKILRPGPGLGKERELEEAR